MTKLVALTPTHAAVYENRVQLAVYSIPSDTTITVEDVEAMKAAHDLPPPAHSLVPA